MNFAVLIFAAYFIGSIPFGFIIAKAYGKDLRQIGSGNIGATNLSRALGRKWGHICFVLDVVKGFLPMLIAANLIPENPSPIELFLALAVGCAAIVGHIFPVFLKFKGGKGVATSLGVAIGFWPYYTLCALIAFSVWILFVLIWRYVSLASIAAATAFPIILSIAVFINPNWNFSELWPLFIAAILIPVIVWLRHGQNIKRLIAGTESKITSC